MFPTALDVRWKIAILLCLITTINYVDRLAFSIAAPVIADELTLSSTDYGYLSAAFLFAYAFGQLFGGKLIDRLGTKRSFAIAVTLWSIAGMLHAFGQGMRSFFVFRVLLGLGEAANFPAANKAIAEWFPAHERSLAVGIVTMGPGLGSIIAPPLIATLIIAFSWQWAFIISGSLGFVWLWFWNKTYREPPQESSDLPRRTWWEFFRYRETWGLMLSRFTGDGAFYFLIFWLPFYLSSERGMDIRAIGMFAWIPFVAADVGSIAGGWIGKRLIQSGMSLDAARKLLIWIGASMVLVVIPAAETESTAIFIGLICIAMFGIQFKSANLFALPADLFPAKEVATIWGIFGAAGSLGGAIFQAKVGELVDAFSYNPVFLLASSMHLLSALAIMLLIPRIEKKGLSELDSRV